MRGAAWFAKRLPSRAEIDRLSGEVDTLVANVRSRGTRPRASRLRAGSSIRPGS